jgi:hypothetical protein
VPTLANPQTITLPYRFDTSNVWHTILKGALGLNAVLLLGVIFAAVRRPWPVTLGLVITELMVLGFTRVFFKYQEGSIGTLSRDRIDIESNAVLGLSLPGPRGGYALNRFSAIRVEFRSGPIQPDVQGGPNEVVWLVGKAGTPNVALARTQRGDGRAVGRQLGALLELAVEEVGAPREIRLG